MPFGQQQQQQTGAFGLPAQNNGGAPGPFGAPQQPAFGLQQQQQGAAVPSAAFAFGAPPPGDGSGFTMGSDEQQQPGAQMARRKVKVKRKGR